MIVVYWVNVIMWYCDNVVLWGFGDVGILKWLKTGYILF